MATFHKVFKLAEKAITNDEAGTTIAKIVELPSNTGPTDNRGIYRISTSIPPVQPMLPHGFTFNSFLFVDDKPLLFHTGLKHMYPLVKQAIEAVIPMTSLAYIGYCHFEADECGSANLFLADAPNATVVCSHIEAATNGNDTFDRQPKPLGDGEELDLGAMKVLWMDAPHTPHGWGNSFTYELTTKTLLCGDLFTQHGGDADALTPATDLSNINLKLFDMTTYWALTPNTEAVMERLIGLQPQVLACMHGSAFSGAGCGDMLKQLKELRLSVG